MSWVVGIVTVDDVSRATEFEIAGILFEVAHAQMFFDICKRGRSFFFIFIAALEGHTVVNFGEEIISIMSGTYYIDYSSSVLAHTTQLLSTLTWLLNRSRSSDPRSLALSPLCRLDVGADSETSTRFRLSRSQFWVLNI